MARDGSAVVARNAVGSRLPIWAEYVRGRGSTMAPRPSSRRERKSRPAAREDFGLCADQLASYTRPDIMIDALNPAGKPHAASPDGQAHQLDLHGGLTNQKACQERRRAEGISGRRPFFNQRSVGGLT